MADLIALPYRASDATFTLVSDATAYFYEAGTSTPLTVYTDSGLGTPRGTSVAADSEGVFAQCWVASGTGVKVDVQDGAGTSLPGFPQDNYPTFPASGTGASSVTFSPVTGNSATDVQTAIANETARNNTTDNGEALPTSAGSGGAFTLTSTYTISAYAAGQVYEFIANQVSVGGGSDTLNVDGVGAVVIKKYSGSTSKADLAATDINVGDVVRVKHDGTHFVKVSTVVLGWELIDAQTASASATLDFTGLDSDIFGGYVWQFSHIIPATDGADLRMRTSTDGGSTYDNGSGEYNWGYSYFPAATSPTATLDGDSNVTATFMEIAPSVGNDTLEHGFCGKVHCENPDNASRATFFYWSGAVESGSGVLSRIDGAGQRTTAEDVDAVRFYMSTGNIASGTIRMYGIRK